MKPRRSLLPEPAPAPRRNAGGFMVLYVGLLGLLLTEQFVVHVPPRAYIDVALLFAVVTVVVALGRARHAVRASGTLRGAVLSVLPVALVATLVGVMIVIMAGAEPTVVAVVACGLAFLAAFVAAIAGSQYVAERRRRDVAGRG